MSNIYYRTQSGLLIRPDDRRDVYPNPAAESRFDRNKTYSQMFAYYSNTAFEDVALWARYRNRHNLYRHTRQIFNPITRVVDFYAEHIYPGTLSANSRLETGEQSAMPFAHTTSDEIRQVAAQMWDWANWQNGMSIMVQHGALTGNVLVEVIDDVDRGKIRYQVHFPSVVKDFRLDNYGNLKAYVIEYETSDPAIDNGKPFRYAKEVQTSFIAFYKNGKPHNFGKGEVIENPYGFVPAVWVKHLDIGSDYGVPAIRSAIGKIDELNSIVSHTADHIHKQIESPRILWTKSEVKPAFGKKVDYSTYDSRSQQVLLKGDPDGHTETLVGTLDPQTIVPILEKLLDEIEKDYPEVTMYEKLREQNIVTAPGASRLMGDVDKKTSRPASNYDHGNVKLVQMGAAIGGWRLQQGDWGRKSDLTPQQQKFSHFDLTSYTKGELDFTFTKRALVSPTPREEAEEFSVRAGAVTSVGDVLPLEEKLKHLGYRADEIPAIMAKAKQEQAEKQARDERMLTLKSANNNNENKAGNSTEGK
jgi:hypothetical protein